MIETFSVRDLQNRVSDCEYWLTCCSFEKRCLTPVNFLSGRSINIIGFQVEQFLSESADNVQEFERVFGDKLSSHVYDHDAPTSFADKVAVALARAEGSHLVVDISTFPRESLLILVKYLWIHRSRFSSIRLFYRSANAMSVLSAGVKEVRSVLGYLGDILSSKPLHLIVMSGFEFDRAKYVIDSLEPEVVSLGCGGRNESVSEDLHIKNRRFTDFLMAQYSPESVRPFDHSLTDPDVTKNQLTGVVNEFPEHNAVILPLNNKLSTVAAGMVGIDNPAVQLCYAQMAFYNTVYSEPADKCFLYRYT